MTIGVILFAPFLLFGLILTLPLLLLSRFLPKKRISARQVADTIDDFLDGSGGAWDWDDFTSNPLGNPALEALRRQAAAIPLPVDDDGERELRRLQAEAIVLADIG